MKTLSLDERIKLDIKKQTDLGNYPLQRICFWSPSFEEDYHRLLDLAGIPRLQEKDV